MRTWISRLRVDEQVVLMVLSLIGWIAFLGGFALVIFAFSADL